MDDDGQINDVQGGVGRLNLATRKFSDLTLASNTPNNTNTSSHTHRADNDDNQGNNTDGLFQVMKAVEAAEATIKQQAEENNRLRTELEKKIQELEKYNLDKSSTNNQWDDHADGLHGACVLNQGDGFRGTDRALQNDPFGALQQVPKQNSEDSAVQSHADNQSEFSRMDGTVKAISDVQRPMDDAGNSYFSQPSRTSFSPSSHQKEGELEQQINLSGRGLMPMAEFGNSALWKQTREHEEEITQLRRHLADYSIKEAQLHNEKYQLEKRIAYMRMAFDQQQQELVDAASKALSYRQDIIEENIRLTYALQAAQQDRSMFVSDLMPLLAEYSLQPTVSDAQSIVSNLKVLFKHLQVKLIMTEGKLKESQYQLAPWLSDMNSASVPPQSPSYSHGAAALGSQQNNGLELVAQPEYSHGNVPVTFPGHQTTSDWDMLENRQGVSVDGTGKNLEVDDIMNYSPLGSRNNAPQDASERRTVMHDDSHPVHYSEETNSKQVTFSDTVKNAELDYLEFDGRQNEKEPSANWSLKNSPYSTTMDDPASYSPFLPPVLEEPSSSFSEAGDEDPLPAIEGLQISGDAFPGRELEACGYSINGTTRCNFEWVRYLEDGSVNYIDGAKQPNYLITADDVDTYLAIEVQPLDNRKRKGELVKVFANEHRKITCDPEMQNSIEKALYNGHASYRVSLSIGYLDFWEPATLLVKREGYTIKRRGPSGESIAEKFSPTMSVTIPLGQTSDFTITSSGGGDRIVRAENDPTDRSCLRDTIVLVLRLFIIRAGEKRKVKKKGLFF